MTQEYVLESYLKQLRLPGMLQTYQSLASEAARANLTYEQFLLGLLREEIKRRETSRIQRATQAARFPVLKDLAEFDWSCVPSLPKARILELAQGSYIDAHEPIILLGNPGLGKSHVASGLALAACRQGRRVRFYNVAGLINDLIKAQQEYQLSRIMATICKHELIVLDELGFLPFTREGAQLLFQVCSALYERVAVIVTTNLRFAEWSSIMGGDERMSAALLDRLTHRATILEFVGTSFRFRQQLQKAPHLQEAQDLPASPEEETHQEGKEGEDSNSA
jgi:DNA replication protein DnaC